VKAEVKTEDESTDDECGNGTSKESVIKSKVSIQNDIDIQRTKRRYCSKRKREEEESNESVKQTARIECSVEGCKRKAADSGTCSKHGGYNYCSQDGCTNRVHSGGVCRRHREFAIKKTAHMICSVEGCTRKAADSGTCRAKHKGYKHCSQEGCINRVQGKGGVCYRHGAKREAVAHRTRSVEGCKLKATDSGTSKAKHKGYNVRSQDGCTKRARKVCSQDGCTKRARKGGVCIKHGAEVKTCSHEGCTNQARKEGVCIKHGAKRKGKKTCSHEACTNKSVQGGVCIRHGAKKTVYTCSHEGCTNHAKKGGVCIKHGCGLRQPPYRPSQHIHYQLHPYYHLPPDPYFYTHYYYPTNGMAAHR